MNSNDEKLVFEIRQKFRDENILRNDLKNRYLKFSDDYPQLFEMITSDNCDDNILNKIMIARRNVASGDTSQHDASVQVGQVLVDKFVIPKVNENK